MGRDTASLYVLVPGCIDTLTGGYGYDRRIVTGLRARGWSVSVVQLDASFPSPTPAALDQASRALEEIPSGALVLVDGLALGAMPDQVCREAGRLRVIALIHHPLAAETGLEPQIASLLEAGERRALAAVAQVVVTSRATADDVTAYGVPRQRIAVVEPGTERAPVARGSGDARLNMLCVASLVPRKGHDVLFRALASLMRRDWRLTCAGSLERSPATVERLLAQLDADGLADQVHLAGELDHESLGEHYDRSDLFVLPTWHEGYGMAVAEALARGLPVVSTPTGAIVDLVGDEAGVLVPPGDAPALASALDHILSDDEFRTRLRAGARRVRERLSAWDAQVAKMAGLLMGTP